MPPPERPPGQEKRKKRASSDCSDSVPTRFSHSRNTQPTPNKTLKRRVPTVPIVFREVSLYTRFSLSISNGRAISCFGERETRIRITYFREQSEQSEQSDLDRYGSGFLCSDLRSECSDFRGYLVKIPQPIPYDLILIESRVLDRQVAIVRNSAIPSPDGAIRLTWKEAMALVASGAPRTDLARLLKLRDEFSGTFEPPSDAQGFTPSVAPAVAPVPPRPEPEPEQGDLFA